MRSDQPNFPAVKAGSSKLLNLDCPLSGRISFPLRPDPTILTTGFKGISTLVIFTLTQSSRRWFNHELPRSQYAVTETVSESLNLWCLEPYKHGLTMLLGILCTYTSKSSNSGGREYHQLRYVGIGKRPICTEISMALNTLETSFLPRIRLCRRIGRSILKCNVHTSSNLSINPKSRSSQVST